MGCESVDGFDHIDEVIGVSGFKLPVHKNGYLFVTGSAGPSYRAANLRERVERWRGLGLEDVEYLGAADVHRRFPFLDRNVPEGHFRAGDGFVAAGALARGLLLGGAFDVFVDTAVERIETEAGRVSGVRTLSGKRL